jgi:hypothetical protein
MFGTAAQFMRMVQGTYPVVYRPASVLFLKAEAAGDELVQPVHMTDPAGNTWLAVYRLQRQDDRSWRIGACWFGYSDPSSARCRYSSTVCSP